jgi:antitoxin PrlF
MGAQSRLNSKGQATIPKDIRDHLGLKPGDRVTFTIMPDGTVQMRAKNKSAMPLAGMLRKRGQKQFSTRRLSR